MYGWLTPDLALFSESQDCRCIRIPGSLWYLVSGAFLCLTESSNYEEFGTATPDETAEFFQQVYEEFLVSTCAHIGEIRAFMCDVPDGWMLLDGTELDGSLYPALYDAVPEWQTEGNIKLPDLNKHTLIGVGAEAKGFTGGAETHTLTVAQIPSHNHGYQIGVATPDAKGALPAATITTLTGATTTNAGSGQAHNNMPPYLVVNWAVFAG